VNILSRLNRTGLAAAGATLILAAAPASASDISLLLANAGVTVVATPSTSDPAVLQAKATGPVQTSPLGNCVENADIAVRFPANPADPVAINGTVTLTSLDGANSLKLTVSGAALPDPANPYFYNAKYQVTITGGTGAYASARGLAQISELIMFTSQLTATATWTMKGFVITQQ
jgi:hypothetical protein